MRDNYLGFEIDFAEDRDGYRVMLENQIVHEEKSYDAACMWIEKQAERRS